MNVWQKVLLELAIAFIVIYVPVLLAMAKDIEAKSRYWWHKNFWWKLNILYIPASFYLASIMVAAHNILLALGL